MWAPLTYPTWQKFNPHGGHMGRLTERSNVSDRPLEVFFKHFGYFECKYGPVVSSGCPMHLGGHLEGRLSPLPFKKRARPKSLGPTYIGLDC